MQWLYRREKQVHNRHKLIIEEKSLTSREPRVSGKPDAMFSFDSEPTRNTFLARNRGNEPGEQFQSSVHSVFRFADPSNVGGSLLEGKKDHLLNHARLCTENTSPHAHTCTFSRCARSHARCDHTFASSLTMCLCMSLSNVPSTQFPFYFLVTCYLTDDTCCLTCATDWNHTKPLYYSAQGWAVWPSGRSDPKHRLQSHEHDVEPTTVPTASSPERIS